MKRARTNSSSPELIFTSTEYLIACISFKSACILLGLFGNLLVILYNAFLRLEKAPSTSLIVNLAISDVLACVAIYPIRVTSSIDKLIGSTSLKKETVSCKIYYSAGRIPVSLSVLTLLAVNYDRYLFIKRPLKYPMIVTKRRVYGTIALIWLASLVFLPVALEFVERDTRGNGCIFGTEALSLISMFYIYIPITLIFLMNFKTWRIAHSQRRLIARNSVRDSNSKTVKITTRIAKELKAVKTFAMVIGVLVLCYSPSAIMTIVHLAPFDVSVPPIISDLCTDLVGINSVFNPLIYSIRHKEYRKALRRFCSSLCS